MKITILGAGVFGMALGKILEDNNHKVTYYDPFKFPEVTLDDALKSAELQILAAPSEPALKLLPDLPKDLPLLCASKGFITTAPFAEFEKFYVLSGPAFASELNEKIKTTLTANDKFVQDLFTTEWLSIELTDDTLGILLCGSFKNVYAIGSGFLGLKPGTKEFINYLDEVISELQYILKTNGCSPETAQLTCGIGDMILTCSSEESRNYRFGQQLAKITKTASQESDKTNSTPVETTEGYSVLQLIKTTSDFIMPKDAFMLSQIIERVHHATK